MDMTDFASTAEAVEDRSRLETLTEKGSLKTKQMFPGESSIYLLTVALYRNENKYFHSRVMILGGVFIYFEKSIHLEE